MYWLIVILFTKHNFLVSPRIHVNLHSENLHRESKCHCNCCCESLPISPGTRLMTEDARVDSDARLLKPILPATAPKPCLILLPSPVTSSTRSAPLICLENEQVSNREREPTVEKPVWTLEIDSSRCSRHHSSMTFAGRLFGQSSTTSSTPQIASTSRRTIPLNTMSTSNTHMKMAREAPNP